MKISRPERVCKISALLYQSEGAYFCLRLNKFATRVITAQSMITKVNKSLYVTILSAPLSMKVTAEYRPSGSLVKYIILSWYKNHI